jgi:hypothetical protein
MDRYFKKPEQKIDWPFTSIGRAVCILGRTGIGKSWTVRKALGRYIELTADILRSKQDTLDFLIKIRHSDLPVLLDEYECVCDLTGLRELAGPPTKGNFYVISQIPPKFDFEIVTWEFPIPSPEELAKICPRASPQAIIECRGDVRQLLNSLEFTSDARDTFTSPKDFVTALVSVNSTVNPAWYTGHAVQEPGNTCSILQQNYVDAPKTKVDFAKVANYFSEAEIFDDKIYEGAWELFPYYNVLGCILPAIEIGHTLKPPLKPGSSWTRYQNMCMRKKKIQALASRVPGKRLDMEEIYLLRRYAEEENVKILQDYKLQPQDIDVLNLLNPTHKIKAKTLTFLKKCLSRSPSPSS